MPFITFDNVSHDYYTPSHATKAIEQISFQINQGEFIGLIGPSGCGKSTILSIIAQLTKPTTGKVAIPGNYKIGYMLQQDYLFPWKTIMENILLGPKINHALTKETLEEATHLLDEVGLSGAEDQYPSALSGGMRQRAALVRTLINKPNMLLLDEPFSALDYITKLKLENLVAKLIQTHKITTVLVTHDISEAISMSDRILLMGASPGTIKKTFSVPNEIRQTIPFLVRRMPAYQPLFDAIWSEINGEQDA